MIWTPEIEAQFDICPRKIKYMQNSEEGEKKKEIIWKNVVEKVTSYAVPRPEEVKVIEIVDREYSRKDRCEPSKLYLNFSQCFSRTWEPVDDDGRQVIFARLDIDVLEIDGCVANILFIDEGVINESQKFQVLHKLEFACFALYLLDFPWVENITRVYANIISFRQAPTFLPPMGLKLDIADFRQENDYFNYVLYYFHNEEEFPENPSVHCADCRFGQTNGGPCRF